MTCASLKGSLRVVMTCASLPIIFPPCETAPCRGRVAKYPLEVAIVP